MHDAPGFPDVAQSWFAQHSPRTHRFPQHVWAKPQSEACWHEAPGDTATPPAGAVGTHTPSRNTEPSLHVEPAAQCPPPHRSPGPQSTSAVQAMHDPWRHDAPAGQSALEQQEPERHRPSQQTLPTLQSPEALHAWH